MKGKIVALLGLVIVIFVGIAVATVPSVREQVVDMVSITSLDDVLGCTTYINSCGFLTNTHTGHNDFIEKQRFDGSFFTREILVVEAIEGNCLIVEVSNPCVQRMEFDGYTLSVIEVEGLEVVLLERDFPREPMTALSEDFENECRLVRVASECSAEQIFARSGIP